MLEVMAGRTNCQTLSAIKSSAITMSGGPTCLKNASKPLKTNGTTPGMRIGAKNDEFGIPGFAFNRLLQLVIALGVIGQTGERSFHEAAALARARDADHERAEQTGKGFHAVRKRFAGQRAFGHLLAGNFQTFVGRVVRQNLQRGTDASSSVRQRAELTKEIGQILIRGAQKRLARQRHRSGLPHRSQHARIDGRRRCCGRRQTEN